MRLQNPDEIIKHKVLDLRPRVTINRKRVITHQDLHPSQVKTQFVDYVVDLIHITVVLPRVLLTAKHAQNAAGKGISQEFVDNLEPAVPPTNRDHRGDPLHVDPFTKTEVKLITLKSRRIITKMMTVQNTTELSQ